MKVPAKASMLLQKVGPNFTKRDKASMLLQRTGPNRNFHFFELLKFYKKRQSVYIIPKGWTRTTERVKASMLLQRTGPNRFLGSFFHAR